MPLLFRAITQRKWLTVKTEEGAWLVSSEIPADCLSDLKTHRGTLSLYEVQEDRSNLEQVIAAWAAGRQRPDNVDYTLFDSELLGSLGLPLVESPGTTPDPEVNEWHRDATQISAQALANLAFEIWHRHAEKKRVFPNEATRLVASAVAEGRLQLGALQKNLKGAVKALLEENSEA